MIAPEVPRSRLAAQARAAIEAAGFAGVIQLIEGVSTEVGLRDDGTGFVVLMNGSGDGQILPSVERALLEVADTL